MTPDKRVTRESGHSMTRELFYYTNPQVRPAHPACGSDTYLNNFPLSYSKAYLVPILNDTPSLVSWYHNQSSNPRQIHIRMPASIHTHYSQVTYRCGSTKMNSKLFLK